MTNGEMDSGVSYSNVLYTTVSIDSTLKQLENIKNLNLIAARLRMNGTRIMRRPYYVFYSTNKEGFENFKGYLNAPKENS